MAWIVKNSAGAQVERRDEPYLDDALKAQLEKDVLPRYPTRQAASLPVLHAIQSKHAWLPVQAIEEAAEFLGVSAARMLDTVSFYEEYWTRPKGQYVVWVCRSLSCELMGSTPLVDRLRQKLGVDDGQTTDDGRFTLMTVECLGSCGTAPCALINHRLHESLTPQSLDELLDGLA